jgi:hypothetical protein
MRTRLQAEEQLGETLDELMETPCSVCHGKSLDEGGYYSDCVCSHCNNEGIEPNDE